MGVTLPGVGSSSANALAKDLPLLIVFVLLAAFTFLSGLRAPALIAFVQDTPIYVMIIVAISYIPHACGCGRELLADPGVQRVVAGHRDRLGRMNTALVESALWRMGAVWWCLMTVRWTTT